MYPAKADMPLRSQTLAASALFQDIDAAARLPHDERIQLTYKRLIAIGKAHGVSQLSPPSIDISNARWKFRSYGRGYHAHYSQVLGTSTGSNLVDGWRRCYLDHHTPQSLHRNVRSTRHRPTRPTTHLEQVTQL